MKHCFSILLAATLLATVACERKPDAKEILEECVAVHGGDRYANCRIEFDFRQYHLTLENQEGQFRYQRTYRDSSGAAIEEVLTNNGLIRRVNNKPVKLDQKQYARYQEAVNAVAYFVLLPSKLSDPAVISEYVGESQLDGQPYHKIKVSFQQEGGGKDYQDVFFYWINQNTHTMDYLAYSEGGPRFRKAINPQVVGGIRFQDYLNYKGDDKDTTSVGIYDQKYQQHQLTLLSRIEQKNIRVTPLTN